MNRFLYHLFRLPGAEFLDRSFPLCHLFLTLLRMSLAASMLVIAVLLLRAVLRKAPKWTRCVLWALVAGRLLCPAALTSGFSVIPASLADGSLLTRWMETPVGETVRIYEGEPYYIETVNSGVPPVVTETGSYVVTGHGGLTPPDTVEDAVLPLLTGLWLAGMAVMLAYAGAPVCAEKS